MKFILMLLFASAVGVGASAFIRTAAMNLTHTDQSSSARIEPVSQEGASFTIRPVGARTTRNFIENCVGRCRCDVHHVTETVAMPGIVTASKVFDVGPNRSPRCPGIGGPHNIAPVPGASEQCYVCPSDMLYSSHLRGGSDLLRRWGFSEHVCAVVTRKCAN